MRTGATDVMLVFRQVSEVREIGEGADDPCGFLGREPIQNALKLPSRGLVGVAMKADRGASNLFDDFERRIAFLTAQRLAENTPQETNIVAQGQVLVGSYHDARIFI